MANRALSFTSAFLSQVTGYTENCNMCHIAARKYSLICQLSLLVSERLLTWPFFWAVIFTNFHQAAVYTLGQEMAFHTSHNCYHVTCFTCHLGFPLFILLKHKIDQSILCLWTVMLTELFLQEKETYSDRLWRHHVIMLQSRLTLLRKLQWTGFDLMIMWLQRFGTVKFTWKTECLCVCLSASSLQQPVIKAIFLSKNRNKAFFLDCSLSYSLSCKHTCTLIHAHTHTNTHCFLFPYARTHSISAAQQPISNDHANEVGVSF